MRGELWEETQPWPSPPLRPSKFLTHPIAKAGVLVETKAYGEKHLAKRRRDEQEEIDTEEGKEEAEVEEEAVEAEVEVDEKPPLKRRRY